MKHHLLGFFHYHLPAKSFQNMSNLFGPDCKPNESGNDFPTSLLRSLFLWFFSSLSQVLDFGNVYVKSTVVKSFSVFNDLPQADAVQACLVDFFLVYERIQNNSKI